VGGPLTNNRSTYSRVLKVLNIITVQAVGTISKLIYEAIQDLYAGRSNGT